MARCSMFALIGVLSVISVAEVHKVEVQKVQVQKVQVQKFQVQKVEVPQIGVQAARVQKVDVGRLLHISIIVGIVHLVDWVWTFCTPLNEAQRLKTDPCGKALHAPCKPKV